MRVCHGRARTPINHKDKIACDTLMCVLMYRPETILPQVKGSGVPEGRRDGGGVGEGGG